MRSMVEGATFSIYVMLRSEAVVRGSALAGQVRLGVAPHRDGRALKHACHICMVQPSTAMAA